MLALISSLNGVVWGPPMIILLVGTGIFLTVRFSCVQLRHFAHAIKVLVGRYDDPNDPGEISHFKALSTALSATIGTGNIVGVAAAILMGGPGAVFWMWVTAFVGMATKFTSCTLAVMHRRFNDKGHARGGPMHYIELGLGPRFKPLAIFFALATCMAAIGAGNMFQIRSIVSAVSALALPEGSEASMIFKATVGLIVALLVLASFLGGVKRIAQVTCRLVPVMFVLYMITGIIVLLKNFALLPDCLALIFKSAFVAPEAVGGGLLGGVIRAGVARGLFSNEAGLGSAAIAHGAAQTKEPIREGLVAMLGPFIDTIVVCTLTALVIISTGVYKVSEDTGSLTRLAFEQGLPGSGFIVALAVVLFAFSSILGWAYYADRAIDYVFGAKGVWPYHLIFLAAIVAGAVNDFNVVILFCDTCNGLMAIPNLIALIALSSVVLKSLKEYTYD